jgi:hypothetical protein
MAKKKRQPAKKTRPQRRSPPSAPYTPTPEDLAQVEQRRARAGAEARQLERENRIMEQLRPPGVNPRLWEAIGPVERSRLAARPEVAAFLASHREHPQPSEASGSTRPTEAMWDRHFHQYSDEKKHLDGRRFSLNDRVRAIWKDERVRVAPSTVSRRLKARRAASPPA